MTPASGFSAPARIAISVLLPAPFWPTSAHTSPERTGKSTPSSAIVAPNALRTPRISKRGAVSSGPYELNKFYLQQAFKANFGPRQRGVPAAHACAVGCERGVPIAHACAVGCERSGPVVIRRRHATTAMVGVRVRVVCRVETAERRCFLARHWLVARPPARKSR